MLNLFEKNRRHEMQKLFSQRATPQKKTQLIVRRE